MSDRGTVIRFSAGERDLSLLQSFQTGPRSRPSSYSVGYRGCLLEAKWPGREADQSLNLIRILRISLSLLPLHSLICPHGMQRKNSAILCCRRGFFLLGCVEIIMREY
jgi:hypothetical protein